MLRRLHSIAVVMGVAALALMAYATVEFGIGGRPRPVSIPAQEVIDPEVVQGGQSAQCTVTLNQVVEGSDQVVNMDTSHPQVFSNFPSTVVVPVGYQSVTFTLNTVQVSGTVQATVEASCNGGVASATLTVTP